jgi:hypothetical protein
VVVSDGPVVLGGVEPQPANPNARKSTAAATIGCLPRSLCSSIRMPPSKFRMSNNSVALRSAGAL